MGTASGRQARGFEQSILIGAHSLLRAVLPAHSVWRVLIWFKKNHKTKEHDPSSRRASILRLPSFTLLSYPLCDFGEFIDLIYRPTSGFASFSTLLKYQTR